MDKKMETEGLLKCRCHSGRKIPFLQMTCMRRLLADSVYYLKKKIHGLQLLCTWWDCPQADHPHPIFSHLPGDSWQCMETFSVVLSWEVFVCYWFLARYSPGKLRKPAVGETVKWVGSHCSDSKCSFSDPRLPGTGILVYPAIIFSPSISVNDLWRESLIELICIGGMNDWWIQC